MFERNLKQEFLFCNPLETTARVEDVLQTANDFAERNGMDQDSFVGVTTDGRPAMSGS